MKNKFASILENLQQYEVLKSDALKQIKGGQSNCKILYRIDSDPNGTSMIHGGDCHPNLSYEQCKQATLRDFQKLRSMGGIVGGRMTCFEY